MATRGERVERVAALLDDADRQPGGGEQAADPGEDLGAEVPAAVRVAVDGVVAERDDQGGGVGGELGQRGLDLGQVGDRVGRGGKGMGTFARRNASSGGFCVSRRK